MELQEAYGLYKLIKGGLMSPLTFAEADNISWQLYDDLMFIHSVEAEMQQSNKEVQKSLKSIRRWGVYYDNG